MADIFKVTRYKFEAEIPTSGYHPGAWILALDSHKLWLCITATYKMRILSDGDIITTISTYSRVISGNYQWLSGLQFHATDCVYAIEGVIYNTPAQNLTHDAADETYTRIDVVYLNINSEIGILKGTPAENPSKPVIDSFTQIELTNVIIEANATTPSGITEEIIYNDNNEWATSAIIAGAESTTVNFENTVSPFVGTKCIKVTKTAEDGIKKTELLFNALTAVAGTSDGTISFELRSSALWTDGETIEIRLLNNGSQIGNSAILTDKNYGNTPSIDTWQFIIIPLSEFNAVGLSFDEVQIRFSYSYWGAVGFHLEIDNLKLQYSGTVTPPVVVGTEIIIPQLRMDVGGYRETGDPYPMLGTLKASWQAFNTEFLKYNPEIWVFRRKSYTRRLMLMESWTNYVINALFAAPVVDWQANGANVAFANDRVEFTNAAAGESISYTPTGNFIEGRIYRIIVNCTSYTLGGWNFKFGTYVAMEWGIGNFTLDVQFHESQDASQFSIISSFDNTTLNIDNVYVIERERTYSIKQHKKWTHEPHLNGVKFEGSNFWAGSTQSPVDEIADNGRHTEFTCPLISEEKLKIEIDPFEYYFGYSEDKVRHKIDENSTWSDFIAIVTSGRRGSLNIPFRFAIVIDNPDAEGKDPKMIGPLSDIIHMHVRAPSQYGNVYSFTQYYKFTVATRKY